MGKIRPKREQSSADITEETIPVESATEVVEAAAEASAEVPVEGIKELTVELDGQSATASANEDVPVEGAAEGTGTKKPKKRAAAKAPKPEIPDDLKKGNRICADCGTPEAHFLEKNSRYSLCQGVDVYCYRKGSRVYYGKTMGEIETQFADRVGKTNKDGKPLIEQVGGTGIKSGILVRGVPKEKAPKPEKPAAETTTQPVAGGITETVATTTPAPETSIPIETSGTSTSASDNTAVGG